jgi:hypothetical protein
LLPIPGQKEEKKIGGNVNMCGMREKVEKEFARAAAQHKSISCDDGKFEFE